MTPVQIAVTGAAGQISYALLFRLIAGDLLGPDQPISLRLLEVPEAIDGLRGVEMELHDCASPLLRDIVISDNAETVFDQADIAFLIGARPRGPGMERKDLLQVNAEIFSAQGKALNRMAKRTVKVLVVGNPANTNALITLKNAPALNPSSFSAMSRLDHNRAVSLLALQCGCLVSDVQRVAIWGNHSSTQYPDLSHARVRGERALALLGQDWFANEFIPEVQQRGAKVIQARGKSSAASAANAAIAAMRDWIKGTPEGDWVSMGVQSDGSYGIEAGLIYSFPVTVEDGDYRIVQGLEISEFSRARMSLSESELKEERAMVQHLL